MPFVTISILEGRTVEQKRNMARDVTGAVARNIGCSESVVNIIIEELKEENVAVGGKLFIDGRD